MGRGSWDDPPARATRGRRLPSLDARSWDHPTHPLLSERSLRPCLGQGASRRARVGRVRKLAFLSILLTYSTSKNRVIFRLRQPVHT